MFSVRALADEAAYDYTENAYDYTLDWSGSCKGAEGQRMDPITFLVGAISAGALTGATDVGKAAISDSYAALKAGLKKMFGERGSSDGELVLERFEVDPETWEKPLRYELAAAGADQSADLMELARKIVELAGRSELHAKYLTNFHGRVGTAVVGDYSTVTIDGRVPVDDRSTEQQ